MNFSIVRILSNALVKQLAIRLSWQKTSAKSLVMALALAVGIAGLAACGGGGGASGGYSGPALIGGAVRNVVPSLAAASATPVVSTIAGTASRNQDGTGGTARFSNPYASVSDGTNLYVADANNNSIRKIVIATGAVTTLAGSPTGAWGSVDGTGAAATFSYPAGITIDPSYTNLYVTDRNNNKIRQIVIASGAVTTLAGSGCQGCTIVNAASGVAATTATFFYPVGITTDGTSLYVADMYDNVIRQITPATGTLVAMTSANAVVTTLAGIGTGGYSGYGSTDGAGNNAVSGVPAVASFGYPQGIATDGTNLYVTDSSYSNIREVVISTGMVSTLAGSPTGMSGSVDGTGTAALFSYPTGITTDGTSLYVADNNNSEIRKIAPASGTLATMTSANAAVTTLAGQANVRSATDGTGKAATFNYPGGITAVNGNLYVADTNNSIIRQIVTATGAVTTLAGAKPGADGTGLQVNFNGLGSTTTDGTNLYVADSNNSTIRQIVIATGVTTTLAGEVGEPGFVDGIGSQARFNSPYGITTDGTNLYVTDRNNATIRQIVIATGAVTTLAGSGARGSMDGIGPEALFNNPYGITTDGTNLYVADSNNSTIRQIVIATRAVTTLAGTAGLRGSTDATGTAATFNSPMGITTDGANLYVADANNNKIRQIVIASGAVTTLAGTGAYGSTDGAGVTTATFASPRGITTDGTNLYVANSNYNDIRKIVITTGMVSTLAGSNVGLSGSADGAALTAATFASPQGITSDGQSLYVTDVNSGTIRKIH